MDDDGFVESWQVNRITGTWSSAGLGNTAVQLDNAVNIEYNSRLRVLFQLANL